MRRHLLLMLTAAMLPAQSLQDARMARGDDKRWAGPAFDDRGWETVVAGTPVLGNAVVVGRDYDSHFLNVLRTAAITLWISVFPLLTALAALLYWPGDRTGGRCSGSPASTLGLPWETLKPTAR